MADMMLFPKTWKEFEEQYGFYDSKQAYMYGNTRLIPSFRVQQWLDHIDDIKRKKQSQKKMKERIQMAENKCEGCICIGCRFKDTDDCFHTNLCIDCNKEYTTMLCPNWKKKEQNNNDRE